MVVLIIGATGTVGTYTIKALLAVKVKVRVLARNKAKAHELFGDNVEIIEGGYDDVGQKQVVDGVKAALLITPSTPDQPQIEGNIAIALKKAGVPHLVKISAYGTSISEPTSSLFYFHALAEENIVKSGIPFTILRPNLFVQNFTRDWTTSISTTNTFSSALGNKDVISVIDVQDIADVVVKILTTPGHEGRTYDLTGPEDISFVELAEKFTKILGRHITYTSLSDLQFQESLIGAGAPPAHAHIIVLLYQFYRKGHGAGVMGNTEILLGRPARKADEYLKENAALFAPKK